MGASDSDLLQHRTIHFLTSNLAQSDNDGLIALGGVNQRLVPTGQLARSYRGRQGKLKSIVDVRQTIFHSNSCH